MISWQDSSNHIYLNPKWPADVRVHLEISLNQWLEENQTQGLLLIPTSGTTSKDLVSTKIVAIKKENFLKSAEIVGRYFGFTNKDRVLQSLPLFHVGGLSQVARAFVWNQTLVPAPSEKWQAPQFFDFIRDQKITHLSLVPTQLHDLVQLELKAPEDLQCVFLGGAALGSALSEKASEQGWKIQSTYGMTETSSMIAVEKNGAFHPFPGVEFRISPEGLLSLKSPTLMEGYLQKKDSGVQFWNPVEDGYFSTEDLVKQQGDGFQVLGRASDFAKVAGEGVYLSRLNVILQDCCVRKNQMMTEMYLDFVDSDRRGKEVNLFSIKPKGQVQDVIDLFNQKVLPFERIQGFHRVKEILTTELGKVRREPR